MSRTYSLRLLLAGITLACVLSAVAAKFPKKSISLAACVGLTLPGIALTVLFTALSPKRFWSFSAGMIGLFAGLAHPPLEVFAHRPPPYVLLSGLDYFIVDLLTYGLNAVVGVFVIGGITTLLLRAQHAAERRLE